MTTSNQQANYKLSDNEFWSALRENGGLYARTARYIQNKYKINFSRQAVRQRAEANPEALGELNDLTEEALDIAEEGLFTLIRTGQPNTRLAAIRFFLEAKGKDRGYGRGGMEIKATTTSNELTGEGSMMGGLNLTIKVIGNE